MSDALFSSVELERPGHVGYRLHHVEVFNWGTFDERVWRFTPGGETALLTGDIGSGKSTLVDALTTLLLPANTIAYNKAAGAGTKERTLRSYVEGFYKSERTETTGRSRPIGLRSGKRTYSVILGVFSNAGYDETVTLAQVFWQNGTTGQPNRFYVTSPTELSISTDFGGFGSDLNGLRRRLRADGATVVDTYPKYGTAMRRLLGIGSEQALDLFHQTVSMKSVGKLDDFVREHMLEPSDAADRVAGIITHFENLTVAHDAVTRARDQLAALTPIAKMADEYDGFLGQRSDLLEQRSAARLFFAETRSALLDGEIAAMELASSRLHREQETVKEHQRRLKARRDELIGERERAGGDRVGELEGLASDARAEAQLRRTARGRFDAAIADAGLDAVADAAAFAQVAERIAAEQARFAAEKPSLDADFNAAIVRENESQARRAGLKAELDSLSARTSNLPGQQVEIRAQLCADTGIPEGEVPFAGELVDIADEHAEWRGAAERVLRPFALSLLVPQRHYDAVSEWVNTHRLTIRGRSGQTTGGRLVYQRVSARRVPVQAPQHDGLYLVDCLRLREGPLQDYVHGELVRRADFVCAAGLSEFRAANRAVTREGQVRSGDRHEKDDRHRVDDPLRWVLGWVNERKIAALAADLEAADDAHHDAAGRRAEIEARRAAVVSRQQAFARLESFEHWTGLDAAEAETRAAEHDAERARLLAGSSRLAEIDRTLGDLDRRQVETDAAAADLIRQLTTIADATGRAQRDRTADIAAIAAAAPQELERARAVYDVLRERISGLSGGDTGGGRAVGHGSDVGMHRAVSRPATAADCPAVEASLTDDIQQQIDRITARLESTGQKLTRSMSDVLNRWPQVKGDMDSEIESRADFRAWQSRVATDDLPSFEVKFKEELNKNTIQELAAFNYWLAQQRDTIDQRVALINEGLSAVPYNPGRYIRLEKQPTTHTDIVQFRTDLRELTNDALAGDGGQYSEQRFVDVKRIIERFRGREGYAESDKAWTRRVTDVRNWFVFSASERDEATDEEWEHYSDSDGKSGGQKEKLAYTILAASLAYQFGLEWGATKSMDFRFAVIDEAFGRGSDESTRYALSLFAKLGLQLLIVTPLQKVHIIEPFVRAIGFVDNVAGTSSRVHTMTIEEYRAGRDGRQA
jgi:uncharacterized protein YPO0396